MGDEGSGSWLGKRLLQGFFYNQLPVEISDDFINEFGEEAVHVNEEQEGLKGENPNVPASFTKFIGKHKSNPVIKQWL